MRSLEKPEYLNKLLIIPEDVPESVWRSDLEKDVAKLYESSFSTDDGIYVVEIEVVKNYVMFYREIVRFGNYIMGIDIVYAPKDTVAVIKLSDGSVLKGEVDEKGKVKIHQEDIQA